MQERSKSGRVPIKLKLSCKQGGREQAVRAYTLPFPHAASKQLSATALGSIDPSLVGSAAVHTLIPNLAPRSRFTKPNDADISVQSCGQSHGLSAQSHASEGHATHGQSGTGQVDLTEWDESSGPHQEAREALFVAVTALLRPKIGLPVLVNFLSIAGMHVVLADCYTTWQRSRASVCVLCWHVLYHQLACSTDWLRSRTLQQRTPASYGIKETSVCVRHS